MNQMAPPTGFRDDGEVDLAVIEPLAGHLREQGVAGVFVNGTTGEGASLTTEERPSGGGPHGPGKVDCLCM